MEIPFNLTINESIVASCIVVEENENIYELNNVFVKEEERGNGYAQKLLLKIIEYYKLNTINKVMLKICCEITNIPAVKTYIKVFGEPYRQDCRYYYFFIFTK